MIRRRAAWSVALVMLVVLAGGSRAFGCGTDRWLPKVFGDRDAAAIDAQPQTTTIAKLTSLPAPSVLPFNGRVAPVEETVYRIEHARLVSIQLAADGDYELYLRDDAGHDMLAESPDPQCMRNAPLSTMASAVHRELQQRFAPTLVPKAVNQQVTLTGVGFFDYVLDEQGHASNGIELHPLLSMTFGKTSPVRAATTASQTTPFSYTAENTQAPQTLFYAYKESGAISREMSGAPQGSAANQTLSYTGGENGSNFGWISASGLPGAASWPAQTYHVTLNVATANASLQITEVKIFRVDANGGPGTSGLATVGDLKSPVSLAHTGTLAFDVSGSAQSASTTDRVGVKFYVQNSSSATQSFAYVAGPGSGSGIAPSGTSATPAPPTPTPAPPSDYRSAVLADNPVQFYPLDESSGAIAQDESPADQPGKYYGPLTLGEPGPLIGAASAAVGLDAGALDTGVHLPAPNVPAGSSFSVETWVYPIYSRTYMTIWGMDAERRLLLGSNGKLLAQFTGNFFSQRALGGEGWHQVVYVYDAAAQTQTLYVDGSKDSSISASGLTFSKPYSLGEYDAGPDYKFHGRLADYAVYASALSASQILAHYHAAGYPPVSPTPQPSPTASPVPDSPCAGYRWPNKVVNDPNAGEVDLNDPQTTSIAQIASIPQPNANNDLPRMQPAETTVYELRNVTLSKIFLSSDYDYHFLLSDGSGNTMIAESPDPKCAQGSAVYDDLTAVRSEIAAAYPNIGTSGVTVNKPVTLEGIAFFDFVPNYATDESEDGIELHPILSICFGSNCTLPSIAASPSPQPTATPQPSPQPTLTPAPSPSPQPTQTPPATGSYAPAVLQDTPKQYYKLDETGGSVATDSSGNGANGTYTGAVSFGAPGPLGDEPSRAIALAGGTANAGVALPNPNAAAGASYSIEAWVYPAPSSGYTTIWGYDATHRMLLSGNGLLLTQFGTNFFSKHALTRDQWHHVVFVYDASAQQASYYIDGALDSTDPVTNGAAAFTAPYFLGQYDTSANYKWNGRIAEAAFYPAALTQSQIDAHYSAAGYGPSPAPTPSATPIPSPSPSATPVPSPLPSATPVPSPLPSATPVPSPSPSATPVPSPTPQPGYAGAVMADAPAQYLQLQDASGTVAADSSGNGANGTYSGSVTFGVAGPLRNESSQAIALSGSSNAGVLVPNPEAAAGTSYSIEIWADPNASSTYMTLWGFDKNHRLLLANNGLLLSQLSGNYFSKNAISRSAWHQIVFVYDAGTQTASYYIDGKLDSSAGIPAQSAAFASAYYLGQYDTSSYYKWSGSLGQSAFYRTALTASQIAAHYAAAGY